MKDSFTRIVLSAPVQTFLTFVRTKNMNKTCAATGLSASAVSRHLARLEQEIGAELIDRTGYPFTPTGAGLELARRLEQQSRPLEELLQGMRDKNAFFPSLRIGVLQTLARNVAPELIARLRPSVGNVFCLSGSSVQVFQKLVSGELDVVLASRAHEETAGLRRHLLFSEPAVLILPEAVAATRKSWDWHDLQFCGIPYIRNYRRSAGLVIDNFLNSIGVQFPDRMEVDNSGLIQALIQRGMGWSVTRPSALLGYRQYLKGVTVLPLPEPGLTMQIRLIDRQGFYEKLHGKLVAELIDIFGAMLGELREILPASISGMHVGSPDKPD